MMELELVWTRAPVSISKWASEAYVLPYPI